MCTNDVAQTMARVKPFEPREFRMQTLPMPRWAALLLANLLRGIPAAGLDDRFDRGLNAREGWNRPGRYHSSPLASCVYLKWNIDGWTAPGVLVRVRPAYR